MPLIDPGSSEGGCDDHGHEKSRGAPGSLGGGAATPPPAEPECFECGHAASKHKVGYGCQEDACGCEDWPAGGAATPPEALADALSMLEEYVLRNSPAARGEAHFVNSVLSLIEEGRAALVALLARQQSDIAACRRWSDKALALEAERDAAIERRQNLVDALGMERAMRKDAEAEAERLRAALERIEAGTFQARTIARAALAGGGDQQP